MVFGGNHASAAELASLMGWWRDAGLDVLAADEPRDWLAPVERPAERTANTPVIEPTARPAAMPAAAERPAPPASFPDTLPAFQQWLVTSEKIAMPMSARVAPMGDPTSGLMVLVDLPEQVDVANGRLLSGPVGELFDKMLGAVNRDRQSLYLSAMAPGWPTGGVVDRAMGVLFSELARHHVALARPRALLLMGEQPSRAFLGKGFVEARGSVHDVQLPGGATKAVATFHPRTLLQHPQQKRRAWEDLQLLMKLLS
ncbi:uracil-DNA glycosylase family protein [Rhizorhabdus sp.]|uniref:uracil-DNA glycosylase family protein n=1 Tax=Rhizorhabdus sp. TaxID=1968843 RepID=UPI0025CD7E7C|nr:uracil-DNA glycosylase family protein [Rhizorhabdus sp.]